MTQLTPHFKIEEFAVSAQFPDVAREIMFDWDDNIKAFYLCATILEPTREYLNKNFNQATIHITSGKRDGNLTDALKKAGLNPSPTSDHNWEELKIACDFIVKLHGIFSEEATENAYFFILEYLPHAFGQLIYYASKGHLHVSLPTQTNHGKFWIEGIATA